jgi:hypothetical protein
VSIAGLTIDRKKCEHGKNWREFIFGFGGKDDRA